MLSLFALSPSLNVPMRAPAPAMMATVASLEVKAGCYEYRSLAQDVQTTKVRTPVSPSPWSLPSSLSRKPHDSVLVA